MIRLPSYQLTMTEDHVSIACSSGKELVTDDYSDLLEFMVTEPDYLPINLPRVVWRLADLVSAVKSLLPASVLKEFDELVRNGHSATWSAEGYRNRIFLQPGKFFAINRRQEGVYGDREVTYYELDQFYPEYHDIDGVADVQRHADELVATFASLGVHTIPNLASPVRVIEESGVLDRVYKSMPDPNSIPEGCREYATYTDAWGAWISAYQVGYWPEVYKADMASAYPSMATRLRSIDGARYEYSKTMMPDAYMGFVKGTLAIDPEHPLSWCSPVVFPIDDDMMGNPAGRLTGHFTLNQVRCVEHYGMGSFDLKDGWFIYTDSTIRPLADVMRKYYAMRSQGGLADMICKRIITGIIGRLGEFHQDEPTKYTNTVYHSYIRNSTSLLVGKHIIDNGITADELIHVNTDGYYTTRDLGLPDKATMGNWRGEGCRLLVLSPDYYTDGDRCTPALDAINADKKAVSYPDAGIDLMGMVEQQNRYFASYPKSGGDLVRQTYQSEQIIVPLGY